MSLFWKLRFHDLQKPWPSTRVNADDGGGGGAAAGADVDAEDDDGGDDGICLPFTTRCLDGDGIVANKVE